jgi:RND family efflux transporter MFP subunit
VTEAASEVAGRVLWVSENFERGAVIKEGEELLKIDPSDYEAAVAQAQAALAEADLELALEEARAKQALRDWERLAQREDPGDLVLRRPQLLRAATRRDAAREALAKAQRDLERCVFRAPYDGRVRSTSTDLGSYVVVGAPLAELYATGFYEVRLPLSAEEFGLVERPAAGERIGVTLGAPGAPGWRAEVVRREGEIDRRTRSVYLIAEVAAGSGDDAVADPASVLMPGRFVEAAIDGEPMRGVVALERRAVFEGGRVLVLEGGDTLVFRDVEVRRALDDLVYIGRGLEDGDAVCITPLALPYDGMKVQAVRVGADAGGGGSRAEETLTAPVP